MCFCFTAAQYLSNATWQLAWPMTQSMLMQSCRVLMQSRSALCGPWTTRCTCDSSDDYMWPLECKAAGPECFCRWNLNTTDPRQLRDHLITINQSINIFNVLGGNWDPADKKFSSVNSYRQDLLPTFKAFPKETTTCIWFPQSHKVCNSTTVLQEVQMLWPDVAVRWAIKNKVLLVLHIIQWLAH